MHKLMVRIDACLFQYIRMDHTAAEQLYPATVATDAAALLIAKRAGQRELKAWFGKWEIEWLSLYLDVFLVVLA